MPVSMIALSLQSGSNGNCTYVEAAGMGLLFDAGISGIRAERRLERRGLDIRGASCLFISHDHSDHVRCAGVYQRKYGLPIYVTRKTLAAALRWHDLGRLGDIRFFRAGGRVRLGSVTVETVPTRHDGADGVGFVVDDGRCRLGILTDLGHPFKRLEKVLATLDAVFLESNYDPDMLASGPYSAYLKKRIQGPGGHISNLEAAGLLLRWGKRLKWACLAHLSEENNHPDLAIETHRGILGGKLALHVAGRHAETCILEI
jgi:phosphoribosyl 1,2-cyclic phosphodiesterase